MKSHEDRLSVVETSIKSTHGFPTEDIHQTGMWVCPGQLAACVTAVVPVGLLSKPDYCPHSGLTAYLP